MKKHIKKYLVLKLYIINIKKVSKKKYMIEKVNSKHLNKVVNRIACAALHEKDLPKANV